jgi:alpha,alpha-trehalase
MSTAFSGSAAAASAAGRVWSAPLWPIASDAFISDCEVNALIALSGNIEWMCVPRPASPSISGAIVDPSAGGFRVGPADQMVPTGRRYLPGSMVMETTWGPTAAGFNRVLRATT